jgi:hypothetical protein
MAYILSRKYAAMRALGHGVGSDRCGVERARLPYLESGR